MASLTPASKTSTLVSPAVLVDVISSASSILTVSEPAPPSYV